MAIFRTCYTDLYTDMVHVDLSKASPRFSNKNRCINCNGLMASGREDMCSACREKLNKILGSNTTDMFGLLQNKKTKS